MIKISKIQNDKYYTPPNLANYCVNKTKEIIGVNNITEYIEPKLKFKDSAIMDYEDFVGKHYST